MKQLSGVVIALNEEAKIGVALRSLAAVCDDLVVVDAFSTDATVEISRAAGARVVQRAWPGFVAQKQAATDLAAFDWVLSLDADEKLSADLKAEIAAWKQAPPDDVCGYWIARKTFFAGRWICHTTWYPDHQLRLFRRSCGQWAGGRVHEGFRVEGKCGRFRHPLLHFTYGSIGDYLRRLETYSRLAAEDSREKGAASGPLKMALNPPLAFFKNYVLKAGFLDGTPGLMVSLLAAVSVLFKYVRLWEASESGKRTPADWENLE